MKMTSIQITTITFFCQFLFLAAGVTAAFPNEIARSDIDPKAEIGVLLHSREYGSTAPNVGMVKSLPGACPILGNCALPGDDSRAEDQIRFSNPP